MTETRRPKYAVRWVFIAAMAVQAGLTSQALAEEQRTVLRAGVMCVSATALARLTLPDGSSRTFLPHPSPADLAIAGSGKCQEILPGNVLTVTAIRRNTAIAVSSGQAYLVPTIDLGPMPSGGCTDTARVTTLTGTIGEDTFTPENGRKRTYRLIRLQKPLCINTEGPDSAVVTAVEIIGAGSRPLTAPNGAVRTLHGHLDFNDVGEHPTETTFTYTAVQAP